MSPLDFGERSRSISSTMLAGVKFHRPESWNRLVDVWGPVIYNWCRKNQVQEHDAADIVQEVFTQVILNISRFERGTFRGWMWTITHRKILDHLRRRNRQETAEGGSSANKRIQNLPDPNGKASEDSTAERGSSANEQVHDQPDPNGKDLDGSIKVVEINIDSLVIRGVLEKIKVEFKDHVYRAFWRMTVDGLSSAEVAEELGMKKAAVRKAKSRVMKRLRDELEEMGIHVTPPRCN